MCFFKLESHLPFPRLFPGMCSWNFSYHFTLPDTPASSGPDIETPERLPLRSELEAPMTFLKNYSVFLVIYGINGLTKQNPTVDHSSLAPFTLESVTWYSTGSSLEVSSLLFPQFQGHGGRGSMPERHLPWRKGSRLFFIVLPRHVTPKHLFDGSTEGFP